MPDLDLRNMPREGQLYEDFDLLIEELAWEENARRKVEKMRIDGEADRLDAMKQAESERNHATHLQCVIIDLRAALTASEEAKRKAEEELRGIDSVLARRPALADCKTRQEMVELACVTAGKATDEVTRLTADLASLREKCQKAEEKALMMTEPCKCDPIGSGEEYCNGGCALRAENSVLREERKQCVRIDVLLRWWYSRHMMSVSREAKTFLLLEMLESRSSRHPQTKGEGK